jgi:hypothetical protein
MTKQIICARCGQEIGTDGVYASWRWTGQDWEHDCNGDGVYSIGHRVTVPARPDRTLLANLRQMLGDKAPLHLDAAAQGEAYGMTCAVRGCARPATTISYDNPLCALHEAELDNHALEAGRVAELRRQRDAARILQRMAEQEVRTLHDQLRELKDYYEVFLMGRVGQMGTDGQLNGDVNGDEGAAIKPRTGTGG